MRGQAREAMHLVPHLVQPMTHAVPRSSGPSGAMLCYATVHAAPACAGSADGSVRIWDIPSHQCIRTLRKPCAAAVTNVLVLPRPPFLHIAGASRGSGAGAGGRSSTQQPQESRKQVKPKRLAPLAPLCKFAGPSGALRPWEDGVVIIHGAHDVVMHGLHACGRERISEASGLAAACRAMQGVAGGDERGSAGEKVGAGGAGHGPSARGGIEELEKEAQALKEEVAGWKRKYAELYEVSYDALGLQAAV